MAGAAGSTASADKVPAKEWICQHQDEAKTRLEGRIERLNTVIAKLTERRAEAVSSGHDRIVQRVDRILTRANDRLARVQERLTKLPDWIAANCV